MAATADRDVRGWGFELDEGSGHGPAVLGRDKLGGRSGCQ